MDPLKSAIAGAEAYEALHVPALFQEWPDRVLGIAGVKHGEDVLDIACGTGVLARDAALRVGDEGRVVGVDPNPGMLAVARRLSPGLEWTEATAESLPFDAESFDRVVSQFGMMFFVDRALAVREMLRVLRVDGRMTVAVWDSLERTPAYAVEVDLLQRMAGPEAADALRAPFVLGDPTLLQELVEGAGGRDVQVHTIVGTASFPSIRSMVEADLRGWLPVMGVDLEEPLILEILEAAERELEEFVVSSGHVEFPSPAHILSASKFGAA